MKGVIVTLVLAAALSLGGCPKGYHALVVIEHDADATMVALQKAEMDAFTVGNITAAEHILLESKIERIGIAGASLTTTLQAGGAQTTVLGNLSVLVAAVGDLNTNGVLAIKNPTSKAALSASVLAVQAVLQNLQAAIASQKVKP